MTVTHFHPPASEIRWFFAENPLLGRRGSGLSRFLETICAAKLLAEPLHSASRVHKLLLSREKRVANAANIDVDAGRGAACRKRVPAGAVNRTGLITRMNL